MNESNITRESAGRNELMDNPQRSAVDSLSVANGSFVVMAAGLSADDEVVVYPSYAIAGVEAHLRSMLAIEAACTGELADEYAAKLALSRKACADDLEAWAQHGFVGDAKPEFTAALLAVHPKILQRAGYGAARYLLDDPGRPPHQLYDELLSEYVRSCQPGLWRDVADARQLLTGWLHGRAVRALAVEHPEFECRVVAVTVPQPQCSRASVAAISGKLQQLLRWYTGPDHRASSQHFAIFSDWQKLVFSAPLLPGVDSDSLWSETRKLLDAVHLQGGVDCQRRADRERIQQATLHWAQWGLWSQRGSC